ncbi:MAG: alpha/beta hydrolase family protein [Thermoanaerobaculia bacterium]
MRVRAIVALTVAALLAAAWLGSKRDYVGGVSLVAHTADAPLWARRLTAGRLQVLSIEKQAIPTRHGPLPAKVYRPAESTRGAVVLTPGLHPAGFDELRLVGFASRLAAHGFAVVSPDYPDLRAYRVSARTTDQIEDAARWTSSQAGLTADGTVGLIGVSFGGGLTVVAAGHAPLADRIRFVLSLGGHGDLPRVLRFLCTGRLPDGASAEPHDYGMAILLHTVADRVVPVEQVEPLRHGIRMFLDAASRTLADRAEAAGAFARAREYAATLADPAGRLLAAVNARDVGALGPLLLPHAEAWGDDPALSPERAPSPSAPVYLLHGAEDRVIPAAESVLLARHLERETRVFHLTSPLLTHAEVDRNAGAADVWNMIAFWARLMAE